MISVLKQLILHIINGRVVSSQWTYLSRPSYLLDTQSSSDHRHIIGLFGASEKAPCRQDTAPNWLRPQSKVPTGESHSNTSILSRAYCMVQGVAHKNLWWSLCNLFMTKIMLDYDHWVKFTELPLAARPSPWPNNPFYSKKLSPTTIAMHMLTFLQSHDPSHIPWHESLLAKWMARWLRDFLEFQSPFFQ